MVSVGDTDYIRGGYSSCKCICHSSAIDLICCKSFGFHCGIVLEGSIPVVRTCIDSENGNRNLRVFLPSIRKRSDDRRTRRYRGHRCDVHVRVVEAYSRISRHALQDPTDNSSRPPHLLPPARSAS